MNIIKWNQDEIVFDTLLELYQDAGWKAYTNNPASLLSALQGSLDVDLLMDNNEVVGLIRTIGDGASIIYIQDLIIRSSNKRKGCGKTLINHILTKYSNVRQIVLLTELDESTTKFYESCGFVKDRTYDCVAYLKFQ